MPNEVTSKRASWGFALLLSVIAGIAFAGMTISGWIHGWEARVALAIFLALGVLVVRQSPHRPVPHGFVIGFLSALIAIELQAAFLPIYFANNPGYALIEIPFGLPARLATAIFAPIHAALGGLLTAGIVWLLGKFWCRGLSL